MHTAWHLGLPVSLNPAAGTAHDSARLFDTGGRLVLDRIPSGAAVLRRFRVEPTAIPMGKITVPLDNHAVIEYGLRHGLLSLTETGEDVFTVSPVAPERFSVATRIESAPATAPDPGERAIYGWYLGMPLVHHIILPEYYGGTGPADPSPELPSLRTYITGTVEHQALSSPVRQVPTASGTKTLIPHQNTTDTHPGNRPHNSFGFFVLRGPKGDDGNVLTDPCPPDSIPDAPLAHRIRIGEHWVRLNHHQVIEYGVETGLLRLEPLEFGGIMTASFPDAGQLSIACDPTGVVPPGEMARRTVGTMNLRKMARANSPVREGARRVAVSCRSFSFEPAEIEARVGEHVAVELTSLDIPHNFTLEELGAFVQADKGETAVGGFTADRAGTYEFYCSDTVHRAVGMHGTLIIR
ncbi:cupredoxin domain-containing protein [Nonomuraea soli]|uniref:Plastocyanin n=1 Tax=Nonomuraea soli TaxID=1032476 RepID=A0A7W0HNS8_9ACTN|nr:cupredoxin domain-containing protein [Nonomuraea soli]MBA2890108.1 plastocyanin [Nonomuraea soli]